MLKPCPFCGSEKVTIASAKHELGRLLFFGMCRGCGSKGPCGLTEKDAARKWSRRVGVPKRIDGKPTGMSAEQFDACYEDDSDER